MDENVDGQSPENSGSYVMDWELDSQGSSDSAVSKNSVQDRICQWKAQIEEKLSQDDSLNVQSLIVRPLGRGFCLEGVIMTTSSREYVLELVDQMTEMEECVNRIHVRTMVTDLELD